MSLETIKNISIIAIKVAILADETRKLIPDIFPITTVVTTVALAALSLYTCNYLLIGCFALSA